MEAKVRERARSGLRGHFSFVADLIRSYLDAISLRAMLAPAIFTV